MAKQNGMGCGGALIVIAIIVGGSWYVVHHWPGSSSDSLTAVAPPAPAIDPSITAEIRSPHPEPADNQFVFDAAVSNTGKERTVYVGVYGDCETTNPPRRSVWGINGITLHRAQCDDGKISAADVSRAWGKLDDDDKGWKVKIGHGKTESIEAALSLNRESPFPPYKGQRLDPSKLYDRMQIWVFNESGVLIASRSYDLTRR